MVKCMVAFIAASTAGAFQEPASCWPVVPGCPEGWTKEKEVKYQENEAQRKLKVTHTLQSQRLLELETELVATGNNLKEGLEKLQESEEIAEAIKGPPTNCDSDEEENDWRRLLHSSPEHDDDLLARAALQFKDLDIEGMKSKFQAISAGVDKSDDKKMHELLVIFANANAVLKLIQGSLSMLPITIKITNLSPLQNDAKLISLMTDDDTSDLVRSLFPEMLCRIGMEKAAAGAEWAPTSTNKWGTLKETNGKMIQKYEAALEVVEAYGEKLAVAVKITNTMTEKLISIKEQLTRDSGGGADEVHV